MPTSFTTNLRLSNPGLGDTGWGSTVSNGMIDLVDPAIAGTTTLSADTDVILTTANGMADQARQMILNCTGSRAAQRTITAPASSKVYVVINGTTGGFGVKIVGVGPTTGVVVPAGRMAVVAWNGSDFVTLGAVVDLHVAGQTRIQDSASASNYILIGSGANAPRGGNSVMAQTGSMVMGTEAASSLFFVTNAAVAMTLDASGNLGLGVTPSAWGANFRALELQYSSGASVVAGLYPVIAANTYNDNTNWIYKTTAAASYYSQVLGQHRWFTAPSGTAGNAISFTQAMTLDASGNLAVGTSTTTNAKIFSYVNDAALPSMGARQDGAGPIQIWQSGGAIERARITSSGDLLLGTTDGSLSSGVGYKFAVGGQWGVVINQATTYNSFHYYNENAINNGFRFYVQSDGGVANYSGNNVNLSDARVKTDIKPAPSYWNLIKAIEIVTFKYKDQDHSGDTIGVIAQQVERVAPELVDNRGFGETPKDGTPLKAVFSNDMYHAAIGALQEAMRRIEALEAKVAALEVK
mgnify:CR=1 FL=1